MYTETKLIQAVKDSFKKYKEYGARSTQKLVPIHTFMADVLKEIWGVKYQIHYMGKGSKEATIDGKYYPKDIDIAVMQGEKPVFCLGIKFITSNYKQNANNYFENMMGETANIQANQIPYAHIIIMRYQTPYYRKNDAVNPSKIEVINKKDISKYLELVYDVPQAHRPNELCVFLVNIDEKTGSVAKTNLETAFEESFAKLIAEKLSPENFFKQIANYKQYYELKTKQ